jgi:hypothetical protein
MSSSLGKVARSATSPMRNYFNQHFEMVKAEIRSLHTSDQVASIQAVVADLESGLVEQSLHQARALARVREEVERFDERIAQLEHTLERLTDVVAVALGDEPDR